MTRHLYELTCPQCHRRLSYLPSDGYAVVYRCETHGAFIVQPLLPVGHSELSDMALGSPVAAASSSGLALSA